ncbi:MAG: formate dehydrogenase accessory sulfurtransferase FdhD [Flavobacteriales bacterium]|nr:formate dehydrogenase accessory sulfurtransferase FdhD [Flavobacteriales bacterium]MEB2340508.1 formate dehydrogenase accessory sulfurtransferase FdhD [Flavobacteriia bacterium]
MRIPVAHSRIRRYQRGTWSGPDDIVVVEEPLEIRLGHGPMEDRKEMRLSVTMRTPGQDEELALGFIFTEGIIIAFSEVLRVEYCENVKEEERGNVVRVELHPDVQLDQARWQRNFYTTSSCGVCGKTSIEAVHAQRVRTIRPWGPVDPAVVTALPGRMREAQVIYKHTGGIHAAALFDREGKLLLMREDVGRHNAVDKVIGAWLLSGRSDPAGDPGQPATNNCQLLVSGRAGFELVQKCIMAGLPLMAAVGAPSSLALQLARDSGLTLIGFLSGDRFNMYSPAGELDTN